MISRERQWLLAALAVAGGALLIVWAVPAFVSSPANVRNVVLSPLFWPYTLAGLIVLIGLGLALAARALPRAAAMPPDPDEIDLPPVPPGAAWRLAAMAGVMAGLMVLTPRIGMVWTAMLAFIATALVMRTGRPVVAAVCAVAVPLVLYAFFAHVAGIAIPQGQFVRLP